ncbi:MAG: molybdate ABC transporter substrate-binding protein [Acidobacteriaceae bacterium]|nr:molybdate ABC transporter substrate-binding protein [Acidobacteriaceae bacterium]
MLKHSFDFPLGYRNVWRKIAAIAVFAAFFGHFLPARAQQATLHVAAAADLTPVLPVLANEYKKETGVEIIPSFGSSATLTQQLRNGAPFDLFLSADSSHPLELAAAQLTTKDPVPYARGTLVLWARKDSPAQPLSLATLSSANLTKLAIANPAHAPYGLAAKQFLDHEHLYETVAPKLVTAENIAQTAQYAESGNAQAGLISLTTASTEHFRSLGSYILIPESTHAPLLQAGVVMRSSKNSVAAEAFLKWLTSAATQARLKQFGLESVTQ